MGRTELGMAPKIGCLVSHVNVISSIEFWGHTGFGMHGKMVSSSQNCINQPESPSTWAKGRSTWSTWTQEANASHHSLLIEHLGHGPLPSWTDSAKFLPCVIETAQKLFWGCFIHSENDTRRWECYDCTARLNSKSIDSGFMIHLSSTSKSSLSSNLCTYLHTLPIISYKILEA